MCVNAMDYESKIIVPIWSNNIEQMFKETCPEENTTYHKVFEEKMGFSNCTLITQLVEVMYAYINCTPDIGYAVNTLSKLSCSPSEYHYKRLKIVVVKYLRTIFH